MPGSGAARGGCTLGMLTEDADQGARLLLAPRGTDVPVTGALLYDPEVPSDDAASSLLLGLGVERDDDVVTLLRAAGRMAATGVVLRGRDKLSEDLSRVATDAAVAVLVVRGDMSWQEALDRLGTAITTAPNTMAGTGVSSVRIGDLFALANAVAGMVGGAVVIVDPNLNVLAYSSLDQPIDEARRGTIIERRPAADRIARFEPEVRQLRANHGILRLEGHEAEDLRNRLAIAVRAGRHQLLGSIWVTEGDEPLGAQAEEALREAASIAAIHLLRHRAAEDLERQLRAETTRELLFGDAATASRASNLELGASGEFTVVAFAAPMEEETDPGLKREHLLELITLQAQAYSRKSACVAVEGIVYAVFPGEKQSRQRVRHLAEQVVHKARQELALATHAGIGRTVTRLRDVPLSRQDADQALTVSTASGDRLQLAAIEDVGARKTLFALREWLTEHPEHRFDRLAAIMEHDQRHGTEFTESLYAYLNSFGDIRRAAKHLQVHQNTLRYRLQRIRDLSSLDLEDPDERLVAALELRLLHGDSGGAHDIPIPM